MMFHNCRNWLEDLSVKIERPVMNIYVEDRLVATRVRPPVRLKYCWRCGRVLAVEERPAEVKWHDWMFRTLLRKVAGR